MKYKVLVIEDDPMVAMINEQYVCKNPLFTVAASFRNGQDALNYLDSNSVDLIVLDVYMPYMDGIETLKKIREKKISSEVIMVTAANDTKTIEETMHLGVIDYLIKPFAYERFQVALEKFVSHNKILKQNSVLDQSCIDNIISLSANHEKENLFDQKNLPKGINEKTLLHIKEYICENPGWQTAESVAEKLGLSVVTARHYMNYMKEQGFLNDDVKQGSSGRPSILYKKSD